MVFKVALNFEDGITRFIECDPDETVADAAYDARINIPIDCLDGICGTCRAHCEGGSYDGGYYLDSALTPEEADSGYCLPCVMKPQSDLVLQIATTSDVAKITATTYQATVTDIRRYSDSTVGFSIAIPHRGDLVFLPGQYVNVTVPGSNATRSYSFSTGPDSDELSFLVKINDGGLMSTYLSDRAQVGDALEITGPLGSFFLREQHRPALLLAGGTGLAPLLSMLEKMSTNPSEHPVHLLYGVSADADLVHLDTLDDYRERLSQFTFDYCVSDPASSAANKGHVTDLLGPAQLNDGDIDIYLCGPPAMVEAVRTELGSMGVTPANFYFEKFNESATPADEEPTPELSEAAVATATKAAARTGRPVFLPQPVFAATAGNYEIGEEHPSVADSDAQFDARTALELAVLELTIGRLTDEQLAEYQILAEASAKSIEQESFADAAMFVDTNSAFHEFLFRCCGNPVLLEAYNRLEVNQLIRSVLQDGQWVQAHVPLEHLQIVDAFKRSDLTAAHVLIIRHSEHAKETMRAAIHDSGILA